MNNSPIHELIFPPFFWYRSHKIRIVNIQERVDAFHHMALNQARPKGEIRLSFLLIPYLEGLRITVFSNWFERICKTLFHLRQMLIEKIISKDKTKRFS